MNVKNRTINFEYWLAQAGYWMSLCIITSYAVVFLQWRGYTNSQLGLVVALGNTAAFLLSPYIGGLVDKSEKLSSVTMLWILQIAQIIFLLCLYFIPRYSLLLSICYSITVAVNTSRNSLITQVCMDLNEAGYTVNYGVARGIGSIAYAAISPILGILSQIYTPLILIQAGLVLAFAQLIMLIRFTRNYNACVRLIPSSDRKEDSSTMLEFIRNNPRFCLLMLGVAFQFFAHNSICNFNINVVKNVGGDTADMGNLSGYWAAIELPAMFLYSRISRRIGCMKAIRLSSFFFAVKIIFTAKAASMAGLYFACTFQAISFAILVPALVEYVDIHILHKDSTRGQAFSYAMTTLGSIFASLLGGILYDRLGVNTTLAIGAAVSVFGMIICQLTVEKDINVNA